MTDKVRIFVNERPVVVVGGSIVRDAVAVYDAALATAIENGSAYVTDGVGRRLDLSARVALGDILRVVGGGARSTDNKRNRE